MIVALDVLFVGGFGSAQGGERQGRRSAQRSPHNTARRSVAPKSVEDAGANPTVIADLLPQPQKQTTLPSCSRVTFFRKNRTAIEREDRTNVGFGPEMPSSHDYFNKGL